MLALDIYMNPNGFIWTITKKKEGGFGLRVTRGPNHNYSSVAETDTNMETHLEAVNRVESILLECERVGREGLTKPSILANCLPPTESAEPTNFLNLIIIEQIRTRLERSGVARAA